MYQVDEIYISDEVVEEQFVCDLQKCKGACCVEGDLGAPLEMDELLILEEYLDQIKPFLSPEGLREIEEQGPYVLDDEGDFSTPTIKGKECAYAIYDEQNILKCGIEQAHQAGKIDFQKPVSCHLYPIRIQKLKSGESLNYSRWSICAAACDLGKSLQVPVYRFVKDALIRKYGEDWYAALETLVAMYQEDQGQADDSQNS